MLPVPNLDVFAGLLGLLLLTLPPGCALLRLAERGLGRRLHLSLPERALLAFFATGTLLFLVASLPIGLFALPAVVTILVVGSVAYAVMAVRERAAGLRAAASFLRGVPGIALALGSLGLLAVEVAGSQVLLPNGVDGTVYALFVNVLLRHGSVAWTLQPYATTGILYPQGAPVWMALPVLLYGWPIVSAPVVTPPLFLSLTVAAGYCFGERLQGRLGLPSPASGLLFAAFFGLVASWPRLYVAGSYDFIFALPMFLVALGLFSTYVDAPCRTWAETLALGALLGAITSISVAVGTALLLLLAGLVFAAVISRGGGISFGVRFLAILGVALAFVARSFAGLAMWYGFPGHVQTATGSPPYAPLLNHETYSGWSTQLDPFVPWKPKVSPLPVLYIELELLLVAGLGLALWYARRRGGSPESWLRPSGARWVLVGTTVLLLETVVLLTVGTANTTVSGIQSITNLWETSVLLFLFYSLIAALPLVAATRQLVRARRVSRSSGPPASSPPTRRQGKVPRQIGTVLALVLVVIPLMTGGASMIVVPGYLHTTIASEANATRADVQALEWAGANLPECSHVLVAPGSAAQFLPEFALVHLVFPVFPSPTNQSYSILVANLTAGVYTGATRAAAIELGVTEVFVTGATTNAYPPFEQGPLRHSSDFEALFSQADALISEFIPGVASTGCLPATS
jgi:hypothetical protein